MTPIPQGPPEPLLSTGRGCQSPFLMLAFSSSQNLARGLRVPSAKSSLQRRRGTLYWVLDVQISGKDDDGPGLGHVPVPLGGDWGGR